MNNQPENNISDNETGNVIEESAVSEANSDMVNAGVNNETGENTDVLSEAGSDEVDALINSETVENTDALSENKNGEKRKGGAHSALRSFFDYVEIFAFSVLAVLLIFTFCFRLCRVDGHSMNNTLENGEMLIATNLFYEPEQGDIIVFHLSNDYFRQPLVKRVIATEGQNVEINFTTGEVIVDGIALDEDYIFLDGGEYDIRYEFNRQYLVTDEDGSVIGFHATVPDGHVFAMGDNRNHSTDSRAVSVGFVDKNCILGKALIRISPFSLFN